MHISTFIMYFILTRFVMLVLSCANNLQIVHYKSLILITSYKRSLLMVIVLFTEKHSPCKSLCNSFNFYCSVNTKLFLYIFHVTYINGLIFKCHLHILLTYFSFFTITSIIMQIPSLSYTGPTKGSIFIHIIFVVRRLKLILLHRNKKYHIILLDIFLKF